MKFEKLKLKLKVSSLKWTEVWFSSVDVVVPPWWCCFLISFWVVLPFFHSFGWNCGFPLFGLVVLLSFPSFGSSFSCSSPLWVRWLVVQWNVSLVASPEAAMRTEGRDGARWPWLPSRPDRALRCPHGRIQGSWYRCPRPGSSRVTCLWDVPVVHFSHREWISPDWILTSALEEASDGILSELDVLAMFSAQAEDPWLIGDAIDDLLEWVIVAASSTKCRFFASSAEDQWTLQLRLNGPHFCEALLRSNGQFRQRNRV